MILDCLALARLKDGCVEWLVVNGMNTGRWTRIFGSNCFVDSVNWDIFLIHDANSRTPPSAK